MKKNTFYLLLWIVGELSFLTSCTDLSNVEDDIKDLQEQVTSLQKAVSALQVAYDSGKVIKLVEPLSNGKREGWRVTFSDNTFIDLLNGTGGKDGLNGQDGADGKDGLNGQDGTDGKDGLDGTNGKDGTDGVTPFLRIDEDGYWCVSYDNRMNFARLLDKNNNPIASIGAEGKEGKEGISVRVVINSLGYYTYETYYASAPEKILSSIVTPYTSNTANIISSVTKDEHSKVITLLLADGTSFTFNLDVAYPTGIVLLTDKVTIGPNSTAFFEFRVNPSNAVINMDVAEGASQLLLDKVSDNLTRADAASYVTSPINYRLTGIEPSRNEMGEVKVGQYKAYLEDLGLSTDYKEGVVLVLSTEDGGGSHIQLSSSLLAIASGNEGNSFSSFSLSVPGSTTREAISTSGTSISVCMPYGTEVSSLVATFSTNGDKVYVGDVKQVSGTTTNDFSSPVSYRIVSKQGLERIFSVTVYCFDLPVVSIETPVQAAIVSKDNWLGNSKMIIQKKDGGIERLATSIKGRGNSTWSYPKKPYAIKLDKKAAVLGMSKHKRWALLANWMDRTLLRNSVAFEIAKKTKDLGWTPKGEFVEVILNGKHLGNYYLCEQIKVDANRVNIQEMESDDISGEAVTGGYLMELDTYFDEVNKFRTNLRDLPVNIKEPDEDVLVNEQFNYIQNYFNEVESLLYAQDFATNGTYKDYIDLNSFIDWWFVYELTQNGEPGWPKSSYMHKDRKGKLKAGPVWDFDWGTFTPNATDFYIKNAIWYGRLFEDPSFVKLVKDKWTASKSDFESILNFIDSQAGIIGNSAKLNCEMWPIPQNVNGDESLSFEAAVARLRSAYQGRIQWLDTAINAL